MDITVCIEGAEIPVDYMFLLGALYGTTKTAVLFKCIVNYYLNLITAT